MKRFFQRVREKAKDLSQPPVLIAAFGDSVTQGAMEHQYLDNDGVYHRLLQQELEAFYPTTTFTTLNAGVSGSKTPDALDRLNRDIISHRPDLVLVAFGLNDSLYGLEALPKFEQAMREIVTQIQGETEADILLLTPPFMARQKSFRIHPFHLPMADNIIHIQTDGILQRYAQAIREIAVERGVHLADIHREWQRLSEDNLDTDMWLVNGLNHPDRRGHKLACSTIFATMMALRP